MRTVAARAAIAQIFSVQRAIRLRDGRERVDDLVREELVERSERPERRHDARRDRELCVTDPIFTVTGMTVKVT